MLRSHRRGFSVIELLIVMAVILTLMGIGVLAYQHIEKVAGEKSTKTRLEMCASMLAEYDVSAGSLAQIEGTGGIYSKGAKLGAPGSVADLGPNSSGRFTSQVSNTGVILRTASQVPNVRTMVAQITADALLKGIDGNSYMDGPSPGGKPLPVLLDGWSNPIIFVPSGGLSGVWMGGPPPNSLISTDPNTHRYTVTSVDGRPFWASAGPDGDFHAGDDNMYSCPVTSTKEASSP